MFIESATLANNNSQTLQTNQWNTDTMADMEKDGVRRADKPAVALSHQQQQPPLQHRAAVVAESQIVSGKRSKSGVVLRPQPSNDPNDPLVRPPSEYRHISSWLTVISHRQNRIQAEKYATYLSVCWFTFLAFMDASAFTVAVGPIMKEFGRSATEASYLSTLRAMGPGRHLRQRTSKDGQGGGYLTTNHGVQRRFIL